MLTVEEMTGCFAPVMEPYRPRVGFEYEILCLDRSLRPLPYEGRGGLRQVLEKSARLVGGTLLDGRGEPPTKVSLPDDGLLSLEPGGQFEFSSAPQETFHKVLEQFERHQALLEQLADAFGLRFFYGGVNPVHTVDQIGLVTPTHRYRIMDRYFPTVGTMGRRMMRQTCSVQVSFDFGNQTQGQALLRTAQYVAPFAAALFANAPYADGKRNGYRSFRGPIWANTDPARTGMLPGFTRPDFSFEDYIRHVLQAPMFFVQQGEELVPAGGISFADFMEHGFGGREPTLVDFALHNSTIFTDVRLKHTVEVRTVDCQDPVLLPSVLAFLSGILFCERSRLRIRHMLDRFTEEDFRDLSARLAREGLTGRLNGQSVQEVAMELIDVAARGLPSCFPDGTAATDHLQPLRELVEQGKTPADIVLDRFGDDAHAWLAAGRTFQSGDGR